MPYPMSAARGGLGQGGAAALTFLLRDDFTTTAAAPLASPRTAEPGPGTLTFDQSSGTTLISSGQLSMTGASSTTSPIWHDAASRARVAGRALVFRNVSGGSNEQVGWTDQAIATWDKIYGVRTNTSGGIAQIYAAANATSIGVADFYWIILRSTGFFIVGRISGVDTLLYVSNTGSEATLRACAVRFTNTAWVIDNVRILDLASPFDSDYGIATQRLSGARTALDAFTHTADCVIEFVATTLPTSGTYEAIQIRRQDATNYWRVECWDNGDLKLREVVAAGETLRATGAAVLSNGHRVVVVADSMTIRVYSNNVLRFTYSSASNFATSTAGIVQTLGTGGAVSDLVAWPRQLSGTAASLLDASVA